MPGPLSFFRKHQKKLLALLVILAMVTFGIPSVLLNQMQEGGTGTGKPEIALVWNGGEFNELQLSQLRQENYVTAMFHETVMRKTQENDGSPKGLPIFSASYRGRMEGISTDQSVVRTYLLAEKAEKMGVVISDEAINNYLRKLGDDQFSLASENNEYKAIYASIRPGQISYSRMLRQLRRELLAEQMRQFGTSGVSNVTPGMTYGFYERIGRRVRAEVLPVYVNDFVKKVDEEPTEEDLKALYEESKDRFHDPNGPEPGFKLRRRIAFGYLKADLEKFIESAMEDVTDEQIEKHLKEQEDDQFRPDDQSSKEGTDDPLKAGDDKAKSGDGEGDGEKKKDGSDDGVSAGEDAKAKDPKDKSDEKAGKDKDNDECGLDDDDVEPDADDKKNKSAKAKEGAKKDDAKKGDAKKDKPKNVDSPKGDAPADANTDPGSADKVKEKGTGETAEGDAKPEEEKKDPEKERNDAKRAIATPIARENMTKALNAAKEKLAEYFTEEYIVWEQLKEDQEDLELVPLPLKKIAKELNLSYGSVPLSDALEIAKTDLGQATEMDFDMQARQLRTITFAQTAFTADRQSFQAELFPAPRGNGQFSPFSGDTVFLHWETDEKEVEIPEFEDIRKQVEKTWKRLKARKLARAAADKKQDKAKGQEKTLTDQFGEEAVTETQEFSWMSMGGGNLGMFGGGTLSLSEVFGVDRPGPDFMRTVYSLKKNDVAVTHNAPQTVFYLVRSVDDGSVDKVQQDFMTTSQPSREVMQIAGRSLSTFYFDWIEGIEKEFDVHWQREPR